MLVASSSRIAPAFTARTAARAPAARRKASTLVANARTSPQLVRHRPAVDIQLIAQVRPPRSLASQRRALSLWPTGYAQRHPSLNEPTSTAQPSTSAAPPASLEERVPPSEAASTPLPSTSTLVDPAVDPATSVAGDVVAATHQTHSMLAEYGLGQSWFAGTGQHILEWTHLTTGLPWYGTIVATVLLVRFVTFPVIRLALINGAKLAAIGPESKVIMARLTAAKKSGNLEDMQRSSQEFSQLLKRTGANPLKSIIMPFVQIPAFIMLFFALRGMAEVKFPGLMNGGIAWFTDLTVPDPTWTLPILSTALTVAVIQTGAESSSSMDPNTRATQAKVKNVMTLVMIPVTFFAAYLPSAVLVYWVTNNSFSLVQATLLKIAAVKRLFGIPVVQPVAAPSGPPTPTPTFMDGFELGKQMQLNKLNDAPTAAQALQPAVVQGRHGADVMIKDRYVPSSPNDARKVVAARREASRHSDYIQQQSEELKRREAEAFKQAFERVNSRQKQTKIQQAAQDLGIRRFSSSARSRAEVAPTTSSPPPVVPLEAFRSDDVDAQARRDAWQARIRRDHFVQLGMQAGRGLEPLEAERAAREAVTAAGCDEQLASDVAAVVRRYHLDVVAFDNATTSMSHSSAQAAAAAVQSAGGLPIEAARALSMHAHRAAAQKVYNLRLKIDERRRIKSWRVAKESGRPRVHDPRPNRRERRLMEKLYERRKKQEEQGKWKRIVGWRVGEWDRTEANRISKERRWARGTLEEAIRKRQQASGSTASAVEARAHAEEQRSKRASSRRPTSRLPRVLGSSS